MAVQISNLFEIRGWLKGWDVDPNEGSDFIICDGRIHFRWRIFAFDLQSKSK
jgi:hypothetical protein